MRTGRIFVRTLFIVAVIMIIAAVVGSSSRRTVSADAKAVNGIRYGYQLESYRFRDRLFLRFWSSSGMSLDFDLPGYYPRDLSEVRWLAGDGAIYLRATVAHREASGESAAPVKILYDFRSGELLLSSTIPLWRLPPTAKESVWLTDAEFEAALARRAGT
jgi:hypothetical protein